MATFKIFFSEKAKVQILIDLLLLLFNESLFILRECLQVCVSGGEAEREGDPEAEAGSGLRAVSAEPDAGLELTTCEIMT